MQVRTFTGLNETVEISPLPRPCHHIHGYKYAPIPLSHQKTPHTGVSGKTSSNIAAVGRRNSETMSKSIIYSNVKAVGLDPYNLP